MITEQLACVPGPLNPDGFNPNAILPYGLEISHIRSAMQEFLDFLEFVNTQLYKKSIPRLESSFSFQSVAGAKIEKNDWKFSGRSDTSRRTITASVTTSGFAKMTANWIYRAIV
jgi:hypothetical protein